MAASLQVAPWFAPARRTILALALIGTVAAGAFALLRPTSSPRPHARGDYHGDFRCSHDRDPRPPAPSPEQLSEACADALATPQAARAAGRGDLSAAGDRVLRACAARHPHRY